MLSDKRRSSSTTSTRTCLAPHAGIQDQIPAPDMTSPALRAAIVLQADCVAHDMSLCVAGCSQLGFTLLNCHRPAKKIQVQCVTIGVRVCLTTHARNAFAASA